MNRHSDRLESLPEQGLGILVEVQPRPEQLQRALAEGQFTVLEVERALPAVVELGALDGLRVRALVHRLEDGGHGEPMRRDAGPAVVLTVPRPEGLVREEDGPS